MTQPRFDRLLKEVQEIAKERCSRDLGRVMKVLVEGMDDHDSSNVTGRLGNNTMVHFPGDASLIGKIVSVRLTEARGFYYMGRMERRVNAFTNDAALPGDEERASGLHPILPSR